MCFDEVKKMFIEKPSTVSVYLITPKGNKLAGTCQLEFANYLNQHKSSNEVILMQVSSSL